MSENIFWEKAILKGKHLSERQQCKLFELDNAEERLTLYISKYPLCDEAVLKLFKLNNALELLEMYLTLHFLSENAIKHWNKLRGDSLTF